MLRRLWHATVYSRHGVPQSEWRFRGIFRLVLPGADLGFMAFGLLGWLYGLRSVAQATSNTWQRDWSLLLFVFALIAFVGVSFPRLWWLEAVGKIPVVGLMGIWIVTLFIDGVADTQSIAAAVAVLVLLLPILWRIGDLGFYAVVVRAERKRAKDGDES